MWLVPFYVAYAGCAVIDNIFIGLGKTGYNAVNSLLIDLGYYGAFYALFRARAITFDIQTIILIFGFGMVARLGLPVFAYSSVWPLCMGMLPNFSANRRSP